MQTLNLFISFQIYLFKNEKKKKIYICVYWKLSKKLNYWFSKIYLLQKKKSKIYDLNFSGKKKPIILSLFLLSILRLSFCWFCSTHVYVFSHMFLVILCVCPQTDFVILPKFIYLVWFLINASTIALNAFILSSSFAREVNSGQLSS